MSGKQQQQRQRRIGWWLGVAVVVAACGCPRPAPPSPRPVPTDAARTRHLRLAASDPLEPPVQSVLTLDQGWSDELARLFYDTSQGSHLVPYDWFLHLEQAGSEVPLRDNELLQRLRFLTRDPSPDNPDGLPIGFARDESPEIEWLGLTCAACHTTQVNYQGVGLLIDGGPAMSDIATFLRALEASLRATAEDEAKFQSFALRVLGEEDDEPNRLLLRAQLERMLEIRAQYNQHNIAGPDDPHAFGYARVDAFGAIMNQVMVTFLNQPDNLHAANAPVSYPFLWDTPQHDRVQWNGAAENRGLGALGRNTGEVLGVFGQVEIPDRQPAFGYRSTVRTANLVKLERWVAQLESPQWSAPLPPIDTQLAARGEPLYRQYCLDCHPTINRSDPNRRIIAQLLDTGTDPQMFQNFAQREGKTGRLEGSIINFNYLRRERFGPTASGEALLKHVVTGTIFGSLRKAPQEQLPVKETVPAVEQPVATYKARPLNGIWATAPYLHNGSVPNLYEVMLPAEQRSHTFYVGRREFDPRHVGFVSNEGEGLFKFRARDEQGAPMPGNSNAGHEYGTGVAESEGGDGKPELSDDDRWALLEYLKTL
ncbi:MAG: hypothetical protein J5I93_11350 [Pirellulaceae bacterium]|nr:hypothetical protein [Pirellulaceae bacterium]